MDSQELQRIKDSVYQEGMSELEMKERLYKKLDKILEGKDRLYLKMVQLEIDNIKEFDEMYPDDKLWIDKRQNTNLIDSIDDEENLGCQSGDDDGRELNFG